MNNNVGFIAAIFAMAMFMVLVNAQTVGNSTSKGATFMVNNALTLPQPTILFNQTTQVFNISDLGASGGTPPYRYQWIYNISSSNGNSTYVNATSTICGNPGGKLTCLFAVSNETAPGNYSIDLKVTDSATPVAHSVVDPTIGILSVSVSATPVQLGQSIIVSAYATNPPASGDPYSYSIRSTRLCLCLMWAKMRRL